MKRRSGDLNALLLDPRVKPEDDSYMPEDDSYTPEDDSYMPKDDSYTPEDDSHMPEDDSYMPKSLPSCLTRGTLDTNDDKKRMSSSDKRSADPRIYSPRSSNIFTAGNLSPCKYSRKAPPAVEM